MTSSLEDTLKERGEKYGNWKEQAGVTHFIVRGLNFYGDLDEMAPYQEQALRQIAHKLARIVHGDSNYIDSWKDVAGYALLVVQHLERINEEANT